MQEIVVESFGGAAPVQATGTIDGVPFYFRARGRHWSLSVGSSYADDTDLGVHGLDVVGRPRCFVEHQWCDDLFGASHMTCEQAMRCIAQGAKELGNKMLGQRSR